MDDRLTERDEFGNANIIVSDIVPKLQAELSNALTAALNRLAAYEDTGLTPEEIAAIKADYEKRKKLREENEKLSIKEGYEPCPKCGGREIAVAQKRVRKHRSTRYWYYYGLCRSCGHKGGLSDSILGFPDAWNIHVRGEQQ